MSNDWRHGFLFVGNHLLLDFINTRPVMTDEPVEMLPDGRALARWLGGVGAGAGLSLEKTDLTRLPETVMEARIALELAKPSHPLVSFAEIELNDFIIHHADKAALRLIPSWRAKSTRPMDKGTIYSARSAPLLNAVSTSNRRRGSWECIPTRFTFGSTRSKSIQESILGHFQACRAC
jgi:hypothetical protein